jgi:tRNA A37 threonylcarbamoyladenosine modification protein TsaB
MQLVIRDANQGPFLTQVLRFGRDNELLSQQQLAAIKGKAVLMSLKFADIIDENSYRETLASQNVYFFGNGAEKCKAVITHPNAHFIDNIVPLAENMIPMAERAYAENCFEDVAYFEPFYLKEFYTTATKKNL